MRKISEVFHAMKHVLVMILIQFTYCGINVLYKLSAEDGMNLSVLIAYRWILAAVLMIPLAYFLEGKKRPKLTWVVIGQGFLCGLFGGMATQNLFVRSLALTSATFATAVSNLVPVFTLILAACIGLEKLKLKTAIGKAKILGMLIGIGGAMVIVFFKGAEVKIWKTNIDLLKHKHELVNHKINPKNHNVSRYLGYFMGLGSCISFALWLIIQAKMSKIYPCQFSSTALMSFMAAIQCVILSFCVDRRNWSDWKLGWNIRLFTIIYAGTITSGFSVTLIAWCIRTRGPVFVTSFNPLSLVLVAVAGSLMLEETLHLGRNSIIGSVMIICGLYIMLWGQNKELKEEKEANLVATKNLAIEVDLTEITTTEADNTKLTVSSPQLPL